MITMEKWALLPKSIQELLASKYGITRSGANNLVINPNELGKVSDDCPLLPKEEIKEDVKPEKKPKPEVKPMAAVKVSKRSNRGRNLGKSHKGKK